MGSALVPPECESSPEARREGRSARGYHRGMDPEGRSIADESSPQPDLGVAGRLDDEHLMLIRRAVRSAFGEKTKAERLEALSASAGSWSGERLTGADYVDGLRGDLDERLRRLGVE